MSLFHQHSWRVVASRAYEYVVFGGEVTVVLWKCDGCGEVKTQKVEGSWSAAELQAK